MKTSLTLPVLTACVVCAGLTDGSAQISTAPNGNVGIGTNAPSSKLSVINSVAGAASSTAQFKAPALGPLGSHIHWGMTGDWFIRSAVANGMVVLQDLNPGGRVGVGTSRPQHLLTVGDKAVADGQSVSLRVFDADPNKAWHGAAFGGSAATVILGEARGKAWLGAHSSDLSTWADLVLQAEGGRLGVGTASPLGKLHVVDWHTDLHTSEGPSADGWAKDGLTVTGNPGAGYAALRVSSGHSVTGDRALVNFDRQGVSQFYVRMDGNVGIGTAAPGAKLDVVGGVRCTTLDLTSDRAAKDGLENVDERGVLDRLAAVPIATWHYKEDPSVQHIGPMAQDFKAAFGVGVDDKHISVVDGVGVSLAAIQGLHRELKDARASLGDQNQKLTSLREELAALREEIRAGSRVRNANEPINDQSR